ncbi:PWI domain-containing protein [Auriculariales sp. MPI-PUGE-AT-0066]|nr:PWI domain-containing protein [Auriculariales sp. MPI-PUGE-AT-0066]
MDAGFFKGTSSEQDTRFSDKQKKLLKSLKFPPEFDKKARALQRMRHALTEYVQVDLRKVNLQVIRPWVTKKVVEFVGFEDEVVIEYAIGLLEDTKNQPHPDPKDMQVNLTGFLTSSTAPFMQQLWELLLEAQDSPAGIPRSFVEEKKEEMRRQQAQQDTKPTRRGFSGAFVLSIAS